MPRTSLARTSPVVPAPTASPRWAFERSVKAAHIPAPAKLILLILATCLGPDSLDLGKWSPGTRRLTAETCLNVHTVVRYAALLEEHGWLARRTRKGRRTEYVLREGLPFTEPGRGGNLVGVATSSNGGVATSSNGGVATSSNGGVASGSNTFRTCPDQKSEQVKGRATPVLTARAGRPNRSSDRPASRTADLEGVATSSNTLCEADRAALLAIFGDESVTSSPNA